MSVTQHYKISKQTRLTAMNALHNREIQLESWLELEPAGETRDYVLKALLSVRAAIEELGNALSNA